MCKWIGLCVLLHLIDLSIYIHFSHSTTLLPIEVSVEIPPKIPRGIIKPQLLIQPINRLNILILQLKIALKIRLNPALGLAFRQYTPPKRVVTGQSCAIFRFADEFDSPLRYTPGQRNLRPGFVVFLADLHQGCVVHQFTHGLALVVDLVLIAKGRVLHDMDALVLVELVEAVLGEPWVAFVLVCCWDLREVVSHGVLNVYG